MLLNQAGYGPKTEYYPKVSFTCGISRELQRAVDRLIYQKEKTGELKNAVDKFEREIKAWCEDESGEIKNPFDKEDTEITREVINKLCCPARLGTLREHRNTYVEMANKLKELRNRYDLNKMNNTANKEDRM